MAAAAKKEAATKEAEPVSVGGDVDIEAEQERNDARKADKIGDDENVQNTGTGIPPVVSAVDPATPPAVSADAPKEDQEKAIAAQSHSGVESDEKTTITLSSGDSVTVSYPREQVSDKIRSGGLIEFAKDEVSVDASDVSKVESA